MKRCSSSLLGEVVLYKIPEEPCGIKNLPSEVLQLIFKYLDWTGIQVSHLVSKEWGERTISAVHEVRQETINFLRLLDGQLQEDYAREKNRLDFAIVELSSQIKIREIQIALDGTKEDVLNILKDIKPENLDSLEKLSINETKPKGFENLFKLVSLYRALDETDQITSRRRQISSLGQISLELAHFGHFDKSLEVALMTRADSVALLKDFDNSMIENGFIPKLIIAAGKLKPYKKSSGLLRISQILSNRNDYVGSLEAIKDIPYKSTCIDQINHLFTELMQRNDFVNALEAADLLDEVDEVIND